MTRQHPSALMILCLWAACSDAYADVTVGHYGHDRTEAYIIASVAVDLRIRQLVDTPNVGVTAILPLDIFVDD